MHRDPSTMRSLTEASGRQPGRAVQRHGAQLSKSGLGHVSCIRQYVEMQASCSHSNTAWLVAAWLPSTVSLADHAMNCYNSSFVPAVTDLDLRFGGQSESGVEESWPSDVKSVGRDRLSVEPCRTRITSARADLNLIFSRSEHSSRVRPSVCASARGAFARVR